MMRLSAEPVGLAAFCAAVEGAGTLDVAPGVLDAIEAVRATVDAAAAGEAPVYGLNTGLGANLGYRLAPGEIAAFQAQLIAGRAVAVGALLAPPTGRAMILARLVSARTGHSGMSLPVFQHLRAVWSSDLSPCVPRYGSIGGGDLTQNAAWARALLGDGQMFDGEALRPAGEALAARGLAPPDLQPKDAMALINHGGLSVVLSAAALREARVGLRAARAAALLSYVGYGANRDIFAPEINALRRAPGQAEMAAWFAEALAGDAPPPRRVQEALSFRTVAPVLGAAWDALDRAAAIWEGEANGVSDSPVVLAGAAMRSTPNFAAPALALALENATLALTMAAAGAVQRIQRMMDAEISGLPRYLSPQGGASAGMVPLQKTAAALLGDIRRHAMPVAFDPAPVSGSVEDVAPMTPAVALKLGDLARPFALLAGAEALVAAQAIDLRDLPELPRAAARLRAAVRDVSPPLTADRALGSEIDAVAEALAAAAD